MDDDAMTRVLVVEDSRTQAEELRLILEGGDFGAEIAATAEEALRRLEHASFDIIVSDIVMPGASGYDLCRAVKQDPRHKATPVLLLTSLSDPIDVMHALECGADSFLSKPCEPERLIARVRSLLENRRLRAAATGGDAVDVLFQGQPFRIPAEKEQILDLLVSTFEDMVHQNAELAAARDALAAKHEQLLRVEQQKEELAALVVHDLRSPAAGILMAAQSRLKHTTLSEAERSLWGLVFTSAEVINRMVLNLLDIASSTDGVFAPRPATVDVARLVADVQRLMTPAADSLQHALRVEVAPDLPALAADPELLRRVLQNLVDNAIRHSPAGEPVHIAVEHDNGTIVFRVRDRGRGVPAALRERIFDKYVRISRTQGESGTFGKGLGLAFCRIAVEAHGGRIRVDDNEPHGSVFVVAIPVGGALKPTRPAS